MRARRCGRSSGASSTRSATYAPANLDASVTLDMAGEGGGLGPKMSGPFTVLRYERQDAFVEGLEELSAQPLLAMLTSLKRS